MAEIKTSKKTSKKTAKALQQAQGNSGFAIIETGGKQYRVAVGDTIKIEKVNDTLKVGDAINFDKVLLVDNGDTTDIGTPYIAGAKVSGVISEVGRNKKIIVLKYKQKSRYLKRNGHRQPFIKVKIEKIA